MTITTSFRYEKPASVDAVVTLLEMAGSNGRVLAGGTDLIGWLKDDLIDPEVIIDIKGISELHYLSLEGRTLHIGALPTVAEILKSQLVRKYFPLLYETAGMLACTGIRNRATMTGNICSAVPCCDFGPVLLVYEATIHVRGAAGSRDIPIMEWFRGPRKTALEPGEFVTGVSIDMPDGNHAGCFAKQKRYKGEDLAQSSVAILAIDGGECSVAFGSVAPTPVRAPKIEALLRGRLRDTEAIQAACAMIAAETSPITDVRSTREYRAHMLEVMLRRGLEAVATRLEGRGPAYGVNVIE